MTNPTPLEAARGEALFDALAGKTYLGPVGSPRVSRIAGSVVDDEGNEVEMIGWGEPMTITLEMTEVSLETLSIFFGGWPGTPICRQTVPALGQE